MLTLEVRSRQNMNVKTPVSLVIILAITVAAFLAFRFASGPSYPERSAATRFMISHLVEETRHRIAANGRIPTNEIELVEFLGHSMPSNSWGDPIHYYLAPTNTNRFRFSTISPYPRLEVFEYDSGQSNRGVFVFPF